MASSDRCCCPEFKRATDITRPRGSGRQFGGDVQVSKGKTLSWLEFLVTGSKTKKGMFLGRYVEAGAAWGAAGGACWDSGRACTASWPPAFFCVVIRPRGLACEFPYSSAAYTRTLCLFRPCMYLHVFPVSLGFRRYLHIYKTIRYDGERSSS